MGRKTVARSPMAMISIALVVMAFIALFVFLVGSNIFDWDHFLSSLEVDYRSWVIDGRAPLWSYQFCGGVTRIGDPQAFGLSPLFIMTLLLGSFWGSKCMVLVSALMGFYFLRRLFDLFRTDSLPWTDEQSLMATGLALFFIMSNYFLWHFHHGHLTHVMTYWALGIVYYSLKAVWRGLNRRDILIGSAIVFIIFSGGFYHTAMFFLLPFYLSFGLYLISARLPIRSTLRAIGIITLFHSAGLLLSSYKWWGAISYQLNSPRSLNSPIESDSIINVLIYHFLPTWNYHWPVAPWSPLQWGIWEYSAFSLVPWILVLAILLRIFKRIPNQEKSSSSSRLFLSIYAAIALVFSLGQFSNWAPFTLINQHLAHQSIRVIGRFHIALTLCATLFTASILFSRPLLSRRMTIGVLTLSMLAFFCNFFTFPTVDFSTAKSILAIPINPVHEMNVVSFVRSRGNAHSYMYPEILRGNAVINCYNPITRNSLVAYENQFMTASTVRYAWMIEGTSECHRQSYFTQNALHIADDCPVGTCIQINDVRAQDRQNHPRFHYNQTQHALCKEK